MTEPRDVVLRLDDGTETVLVDELGAGRFRLRCFPICSCEKMSLGDVFEAKQLTDGTLEYIRRIERGHYKKYTYVLSEKLKESTQLANFLDRVLEMDCHWEIIFGGLLMIGVPRGVKWNPTEDLDRVLQEVGRESDATP
jgi:hypothetical protein